MRHPRLCRNFAKFKNCKFVRCAYTHSKDNEDNENNNNMNELTKEVDELKQQVQRLSKTYCSKNESKIQILEDEVKVLRLEIKKLVEINKKLYEKNQDISENKIPEVINASLNIPLKVKFKCDMCDSTFKKKITLEKHKNTKHNINDCSTKKKIGEGQFGFSFDVRPGKEAEAEDMRLEWKEQKKDSNTIFEKEKNIFNNTIERRNSKKKVVMMRKTKKQ